MFKQRVDYFLSKKGMNQSDLAKGMGVSQANISKVLNGNPTLSMITNIAKVLDVDPGELIKEEVKDVERINGYVEFGGEIHKLRSVDDLNKLYAKFDHL